MADGSVVENIQFSLEVVDLDEDIEMTDGLFCNEDVEEDCVVPEEEISSFDFDLSIKFRSPFSFTFLNLIPVLKLRPSFILFPKLLNLSTTLPIYKVYSATFS